MAASDPCRGRRTVVMVLAPFSPEKRVPRVYPGPGRPLPCFSLPSPCGRASDRLRHLLRFFGEGPPVRRPTGVATARPGGSYGVCNKPSREVESETQIWRSVAAELSMSYKLGPHRGDVITWSDVDSETMFGFSAPTPRGSVLDFFS